MGGLVGSGQQAQQAWTQPGFMGLTPADWMKVAGTSLGTLRVPGRGFFRGIHPFYPLAVAGELYGQRQATLEQQRQEQQQREQQARAIEAAIPGAKGHTIAALYRAGGGLSGLGNWMKQPDPEALARSGRYLSGLGRALKLPDDVVDGISTLVSQGVMTPSEAGNQLRGLSGSLSQGNQQEYKRKLDDLNMRMRGLGLEIQTGRLEEERREHRLREQERATTARDRTEAREEKTVSGARSQGEQRARQEWSTAASNALNTGQEPAISLDEWITRRADAAQHQATHHINVAEERHKAKALIQEAEAAGRPELVDQVKAVFEQVTGEPYDGWRLPLRPMSMPSRNP